VEKDHEQKTKRTRLKNREEEEEEERASRTSKRNCQYKRHVLGNSVKKGKCKKYIYFIFDKLIKKNERKKNE
jgi:hypothetical protein